MAPTRELAQQIDRQLQGFAYFMPVSGMAIYGGTDGHTYDQQRKSLKMGADVVIATPGRPLAHPEHGICRLGLKSHSSYLTKLTECLIWDFTMTSCRSYRSSRKKADSAILQQQCHLRYSRWRTKFYTTRQKSNLQSQNLPKKSGSLHTYVMNLRNCLILKRYLKRIRPQRVIVFSSSKLKVKNLSAGIKR